MGERLSKVLLKLPEQEYLGKFTKDLEHIRDDLIMRLCNGLWPAFSCHPKCGLPNIPNACVNSCSGSQLRLSCSIDRDWVRGLVSVCWLARSSSNWGLFGTPITYAQPSGVEEVLYFAI